MKKMIFIPVAALAACMAPQEEAELGLTAHEQARLAEALEGRVPGETVTCVSMRELGGNRSIGDEIILFDGIGDTIWVNPAGCPKVRMGRVLKVNASTTQLCRGDIASVIDPTTGIDYGGCALGSFTPYRRPR